MNATAVRESWIGRVIDGRFPLLQWLGESDHSDVFLTELNGPGSQKAAIKLMSGAGADAERRLAGWAAAGNLAHPNLVKLFHTGRCQFETVTLLYVVMEYAEENLSQIIPERPLTPNETSDMLWPILGALSYLHEKSFVHGHLKPSNILVVDNQLKLSSDDLAAAGELSKASLSVYDAPEVGRPSVTPAADVWSLGVTLSEALTQQTPTWDRSKHSDPTLPSSLPQPFAGLVRECLRYEASQRCSLREIKARLDPARFLRESGDKPVAVAPAKRSIKGPVTVFLLLVALAAVGWRLLRQHGQPAQVATPEPVHEAASAPPPSSTPAPQPQPPPVSGMVKGEVVGRVVPTVPRSASRTITGKVRVQMRVAVDASGNVSDVKFESAGPSKYFGRLAQESVRQWKFTPAQVDGKPISSTWDVTYRFGRDGVEASPVEKTP